MGFFLFDALEVESLAKKLDDAAAAVRGVGGRCVMALENSGLAGPGIDGLRDRAYGRRPALEQRAVELEQVAEVLHKHAQRLLGNGASGLLSGLWGR